MTDFRLSELIEISTIQELADAHFAFTGMPIGIVDALDGSILVAAGWQDICTRFHRVNPSSLASCKESDEYIKKHLVGGEACAYRCKNGLWDIGVPIIVGNRHLATIFLGQFFYEGESVDRGFFISQAEKHGFDLPEYLAALDRVPVLPEKKVERIISYNKSFTAFIVELAERSLRNAEVEEELRLAHSELEKRVAERTAQLEITAEGLRKSEKKYRTLFEKSKDAIFISDSERRIFDMNQAGEELFGYSREELRVLDLVKLYCNEDDRDLLWNEVHRQGFVNDFEVEMKRKDGRKILANVSMTMLRDDSGRISGYQGIIHDMTERKKLEQQLLMAQKMESVGILAGGVAHDFNNLITAISGYGEILMEGMPEDDAASHECVTNILNAADRASQLTRGLLAFSRRQIITPKPVQVNSLIKTTSKLIERIIGEDIHFTTNLCPTNLMIKADPGQIEQVLMNLATNARDAMPDGGTLSIATAELAVERGSEKSYDLPAPGKYAVVSMADTGTGMNEQTLKKIFEPFYTTKEVGKGTGLGLAVVHGIAKQHNGSILVHSEPGRGTTFELLLPVIEMGDLNDESTATRQNGREMDTLLLAEDDETVAVYMNRILERAGYKVILAGDGEEAVERFKEHDDISLVLSDVVMPRMNGKELLDQIRQMKPDVKAIFVSGYAADVLQRKGTYEEGIELIRKPFKKEDLLQTVRKVLDRE